MIAGLRAKEPPRAQADWQRRLLHGFPQESARRARILPTNAITIARSNESTKCNELLAGRFNPGVHFVVSNFRAFVIAFGLWAPPTLTARPIGAPGAVHIRIAYDEMLCSRSAERGFSKVPVGLALLDPPYGRR